MKILWLSNSPWAATGYGNQTGLFLPHINNLGHEISVTAFYGLEGRMLELNGTRIYPKGQQERLNILPIYNSSIKKEESGTFYHGMWNKRPLYKYIFPDGRMYFEKLQEAIWSSGPVLFTALVDESGRWVPESLWTEEGIKA